MADVQRIEFDKLLYRADAVESTIEAYGHLATFTLSSSNNATVVEIRDPDERVADRLADALCNHVLYETVARHRAEKGEGL